MRISSVSGVFTAAIVVGSLVVVAVLLPNTPLPRAWNPSIPLRVSDEYSPITGWKARRALKSLDACVAAMDTADVIALPPLEVSPECGIIDRVRISRFGSVSLDPIETDCTIALRLALWERHDLQDVARDSLSAEVTRIDHLSSFSCRPMRTSTGDTTRMSTHATGEAIDITGFGLSDGRSLRLARDWDATPETKAFLKAAQKSACRWFGGVLGPDYNALHTDHFHMQARGRGFCR